MLIDVLTMNYAIDASYHRRRYTTLYIYIYIYISSIIYLSLYISLFMYVYIYIYIYVHIVFDLLKGSTRAVIPGLDVDSLPGVYLNGAIVQGRYYYYYYSYYYYYY